MTEDRDPKLEAAYRALGAEEPPRALDDAILAAARREAGARPGLPGRTGRQRWYAPLATAAVLVLAVATALNVQQERPEIASTAKLDAPAPVAANVEKDSAKAVGKAEAQSEVAVSRSEREVRQEPKSRKAPEAFPAERQEKPAADNRANVAAAAAAPAAPPADKTQAEAPALAKRADSQSVAGAAAGSLADAPATARAPAAAAPAKKEMQRDQLAAERAVATPEQELERIADLRKEQKHDEADKALAEFRKRHPDFKIPAPMLERVERR